MLNQALKQIALENQGTEPLYLRNLLKERLQFYVLNFIYNSKWGESFIFKGGSCLRIFFQLPRLSEDLDFDILNFQEFVLKDFLFDIERYFSETLQYQELKIKISGKKNIVYLKFPETESDKVLFLRIDLAPVLGKKYQTEISLKSVDDFSFLVKRYALVDLFTGKIAAILQRKTKEKQKTIPRIKGRDYFDLVWFLENKTQPNFAYLKELTAVKNKIELKQRLEQKVKEVDLKTLKDDLRPLFKNKTFLDDFLKNYQELAVRLIKKL